MVTPLNDPIDHMIRSNDETPDSNEVENPAAAGNFAVAGYWWASVSSILMRRTRSIKMRNC
jgi:hypothetical protein